jgi:hypothetical protein
VASPESSSRIPNDLTAYGMAKITPADSGRPQISRAAFSTWQPRKSKFLSVISLSVVLSWEALGHVLSLDITLTGFGFDSDASLREQLAAIQNQMSNDKTPPLPLLQLGLARRSGSQR